MKSLRISSYLALSSLVVFLAALSGCGYTFQTSRSPLAEKEGIHRIYVAPLINSTYKPGVENTVYNALLRTISVHRRVKLVSDPNDADAVLHGTVTEADYGPSALTTASSLNPNPNPLSPSDRFANILVATEYMAVLTCNFSLVRTHPAPGQRTIVWTSSFTRSAPFAAENQLGPQGDTSELINDSEFDRALGDLATAMMDDVHESMLAMF